MLSDIEKLLYVFIFSLFFTILILIIFYFFRKYRQDRLLCKFSLFNFQADKYGSDYHDLVSNEIELEEEVTRQSKPGTYARSKLEENKKSISSGSRNNFLFKVYIKLKSILKNLRMMLKTIRFLDG